MFAILNNFTKMLISYHCELSTEPLILFSRYVRWSRTQPQTLTMFTYRLSPLFGPNCSNVRPGHGTVSMSHLPRADHHSQGWGHRATPLFSCQPTFGSDGKTKARSDSQVFHPSDAGKQDKKTTLAKGYFTDSHLNPRIFDEIVHE